jgi:Mrp family chromosome partitioning ATPase
VIIAEHCDGAVLVIEANAISYKFVQKVKSQLDKGKCRILGAVLNKVDLNKEHQYYGKKYKRYEKQYYTAY